MGQAGSKIKSMFMSDLAAPLDITATIIRIKGEKNAYGGSSGDRQDFLIDQGSVRRKIEPAYLTLPLRIVVPFAHL